MGVSLFDDNNKLRASVRETVVDKAVCDNGGVLFTSVVEIHRDHRGQELGLHFLKGMMDALKGTWSIAIMFPAPVRHAKGGNDSFQDVVNKMSKYFARLSYRQVYGDRKHPLNKYWIVEASKYTGEILSKDSVADLVVRSPKREAPSKVDKDLINAVVEFTEGGDGLSILRDKLVEGISRGGNVNRAHCIIYAAANRKIRAIPLLINKFGAQIDYPDSATNGLTALMVAASQHNYDVVYTLLRLGANPKLKNNAGEDALCILKKELKGFKAYCRSVGVDPNDKYLKRRVKRCIALLRGPNISIFG
jgi:hypothetical protein